MRITNLLFKLRCIAKQNLVDNNKARNPAYHDIKVYMYWLSKKK